MWSEDYLLIYMIRRYEYGDRCFMNSVLNIYKLLIKFIFKNREFNIIGLFVVL